MNPGAQFAELLQRGQSLARHLAQFRVGGDQQIGVGAAVGPAHAPAQLVELRQPVAFGAVHHDGVRQRYIQAVLDDGGRDKHVELVPHEAQHHALELGLRHLPMAHADARLRHKLLDQGGALPDGIDAVVQEVNLAAAPELLLDGGADQFRIEMRHHGVDGQPVLGRRLDDAHVADAQQRHVQRARNGRGAHGQHVHVLRDLFEPLFVADAEALLFVHDQQAQVAELDVLRQQPVRADENVHLAVGQIRQHRLDLLGRAEAAEHFDAHREGRETALESFVVLERQDGGGRQHRHLLAVAQRLERRAHGHFGFAETHVAAQQAVHGARASPCRA